MMELPKRHATSLEGQPALMIAGQRVGSCNCQVMPAHFGAASSECATQVRSLAGLSLGLRLMVTSGCTPLEVRPRASLGAPQRQAQAACHLPRPPWGAAVVT